MPAALPSSPAATGVSVRAAARLHLGFLDPSGSLGRPFGSLGVMIEGYPCVVEISPASADVWRADDDACAAELDRAVAHVAVLRQRSGLHQPLQLRLRRVMPAHAGFGSGTQLALAVGRAFSEWQGLNWSTATLAMALGRGRRSGIGIAGFDAGGLLLDGGPGAGGTPSPVLSRVQPPPAWRVIVAEDRRVHGLSGAQEKAAIAQLPPLPRAQAADICHHVLMQVLPGAIGNDMRAFATGVNLMQDVLGQHFAAAQGGSGYTSASVQRLMSFLRGETTAPRAAVGQSSWGPTGFAIVESEATAQALLQQARQAGVLDPALTVSTVALRNRGAEVAALGA